MSNRDLLLYGFTLLMICIGELTIGPLYRLIALVVRFVEWVEFQIEAWQIERGRAKRYEQFKGEVKANDQLDYTDKFEDEAKWIIK